MKSYREKSILSLYELGELDNKKPSENREKYLIWKQDKLTNLEFETLEKNGYKINGDKNDVYNIAYIKTSEIREVKLPPKYIECFFGDLLNDNIVINKTNLNISPTVCPRLLSKYKKTDKKTHVKKQFPKSPKCILKTDEIILLKRNIQNPLLLTNRLKMKFPSIYISETIESKPRKKRNKVDDTDN